MDGHRARDDGDGIRRGINVTQRKTGKKLWIPFTVEFEGIVSTWERRPGPFVVKPDGGFYTRQQLSCHWWAELRNNAKLKPLEESGRVLHGLRATAVVRARKRGLNDLQIANIFGMSEKMVHRYSRLADQGEMAMAAVHVLDRTAGEQKHQTIQKVLK